MKYLDIVRRKGLAFAMPALIAIFPALFLYFTNAGVVDFSEVLPLCAFFFGIAVTMFLIALLIIRSLYKSSLVASVFCLTLFNFALIEKALKILFSTFYYWQMALLVFFIALHISWLICKKCSLSLAKDICNIACVVLTGLIVFNGIFAVPKIINKANAEKEIQQENEVTQDMIKLEYSPNIYLLIFDEFASFTQIEQAYGYENRQLKDFLRENGFTISYNSFNESTLTSTVTTNLVNLKYLVDDNVTDADKAQLRENGELFSLLKQYGYDIRTLSSDDFYGETFETTIIPVNKGAVSMGGDDFKSIVLKQSIVYPFIVINTDQMLGEVIETIQYVSQNIPEAPTFTLMHLGFPHQPFLVDRNGHLISPEDANNWSNSSVYKEQYIFATKLMIELLNEIKANDPNSLIIVMSDHGARGPKGITREKSEGLFNNIFNAFYYQGDDLTEYADKSSVNTLGLLLNKVIGISFEEVEVPKLC